MNRQATIPVDPSPRRRQVLDEAEKMIGARGYHGFGIQELAARCGLTKPGLLHHFGSKDQLLIALLRDREAEHEDAIRQLLGGGFDAAINRSEKVAILRNSLCTLVERQAAKPDLLRLQLILRIEAINGSHPAHSYFQARESAKIEIIAGIAAQISLEPVSLARQLLALMGGLEEQWLREGQEFDLPAEFAKAAAVFLK